MMYIKNIKRRVYAENIFHSQKTQSIDFDATTMLRIRKTKIRSDRAFGVLRAWKILPSGIAVYRECTRTHQIQ